MPARGAAAVASTWATSAVKVRGTGLDRRATTMERAALLAHEHELGLFLNDQAPFGPWAAESFSGNEFVERAIFDTENAMYLEALKSRPPFIIGRRGSGKTAFMNAKRAQAGAYTLELHTSAAFSLIDQILNHWTDIGITFYLSHVRGVWRTAIWQAVFTSLARSQETASNEDVRILQSYVDGLIPPDDNRPDAAFTRFCLELIARTTVKQQTLAFDSESFSSNGISYIRARTAAISILRRQGRDFLVLIDSMEDFDRVLQIPYHSMEGLLALAGERSRDSEPYRLRIALPGELYHLVREMSTNANKDFAGSIVMHWNASDLIRIAARRFALFALITHPDCLKDMALQNLDPDDSASTERLLRNSLPKRVEGTSGGWEDPLAYLLRHTQLLPRHLLILLNRVWVASRGEDKPGILMSSTALASAVKDAEGDIVDEICKAYEPVHPNAKRLCQRLIPNLDYVVTDAALHKAYNQHARPKGKKAPQYRDVRDMLVEIGALGRLIDTHDRYIEAEFEYTNANRLGIAADESMVLHPLFAGVFGSHEARERHQVRRLVYPYGCHPNSPLGAERRT